MTRAITEIIIHCSATPPEMDIGRKEIDLWHRKRGWLMIGYHRVIRRDGTIEVGRKIEMAGAHARGHNKQSIGICLVGGVNGNGKPDDNFEREQRAALFNLVGELHGRWPEARILGHNEISHKACPSFDVQAWLKANPFLD